MTRSDALRVSEMHFKQHGVRGLMGALDCWHWIWKNSPVGWQGQLQGKEGHPTMVLEALADCSLWIWSAVFGYPGTMNDINIWECITILKALRLGSRPPVARNWCLGFCAWRAERPLSAQPPSAPQLQQLTLTIAAEPWCRGKTR